MSSENMIVEFLEECTDPENSIINRSQIKIKGPSVDRTNMLNKNNTKPMEEFTQNLKLKHYRGKCAEVFIENDECYIVCEFCEINFNALEVFLCHIYKRHLILKSPYHEKFSLQEEQCVSSQTKKSKKENKKNGISKKKNPKTSPTKYLIDIDSKGDNNQNLLEIIEDDNSNFSDANAVSDYLNPIKTFIINSDNQTSKFVCVPPSNENEILFDEFLINSQQLGNEYVQHEFNMKPSVVTEESISYESSFCCDICNEIFNSTKDYKKHYEKHQNEWKNYTCPICPKSFGSIFFQEKEFNSHMRRHLQQQGQKDFSCQHCSEIFVKQIDLLRHIEANHSNLFLIEKHNSNELFGDALESI